MKSCIEIKTLTKDKIDAIISYKLKQDKEVNEMRREDCSNCACLVEGNGGAWVCDELEVVVEEVNVCPEGIENTECISICLTDFKNRKIENLEKLTIKDYLKKEGIDTDVDRDATNFDELRQVLEAYNIYCWDYPLEEIDHCNELELNIAIVYYFSENICNERLWEI